MIADAVIEDAFFFGFALFKARGEAKLIADDGESLEMSPRGLDSNAGNSGSISARAANVSSGRIT